MCYSLFDYPAHGVEEGRKNRGGKWSRKLSSQTQTERREGSAEGGALGMVVKRTGSWSRRIEAKTRIRKAKKKKRKEE